MTAADGLQALAIVGTAIGAFWDFRKGTIPNWLTLSLIAVGPAVGLAVHGTTGFLESCLGVCFCGFVPFVAWRQDPEGMGGGDVKLFAAIGGLLGPWIGLEAEFYAMVVSSLAALAVLAWKRELVKAFGNLFFMVFNRVLPRKWRREVAPSLKTRLRVGPYIFVGTAVAVLLQHADALGVRP